MKEIILNEINDLISCFLYYDRKEDEDLPREAIQNAVLNKEITIDEMVEKFKECLTEGLKVKNMTEVHEKELYELFEDSGLTPEQVMEKVDAIIAIHARNSRLVKVKEFMTTFNQKVNDEIPKEFDENLAKLRVSLIHEENTELAEALGKNVLNAYVLQLQKTIEKITDKFKKNVYSETPNWVEVLDALLDIDYVNLGAVHSFGMGDCFNSAFDDVHKSNMSKACYSEEEAQQTVSKYYLEDINVICTKKDDKFLVMRESDKKVLKSINYKPVNLASYVV